MLSIILTGDYQHDDFAHILERHCAEWIPVDWNVVSDPTALPAGVDLFIIAQSRRNQFAASDVLALKRRYPLTPIVCLAGSWCEGETRSGHPIAGTVRVLWHRWAWHYERFQLEMRRSGVSCWHAPPRAMIDRSSHLGENGKKLANAGSGCAVLISTAIRASFESLREICSDVGMNATWLEAAASTPTASTQDRRTFDCGIFDCDSLSREGNSRRTVFQISANDFPFIVLTGFPRAFEWHPTMKEPRINCIISKPFEAVELQQALINTVTRKRIEWERAAG